MASCFFTPNLAVSSSPSLARRAFFNPLQRVQICPTTRFGRGLTVAAGAAPTASSYALAFLLPVSLVAVTFFASIRLADKLDEDFLEELALNQAILEAEEGEGEEEEESDVAKPLEPPEPEPVLPRNRNRPKRVA